ncbi:hypothetical protein SDC9_139782 [bioreactor metagenome]|uniref:Uncharacterized protein n=1 Tax=bioreactor metagenome TaxID=1076179 RepID=A0A645DTG0_9ZZZZ
MLNPVINIFDDDIMLVNRIVISDCNRHCRHIETDGSGTVILRRCGIINTDRAVSMPGYSDGIYRNTGIYSC